MTHAQLRRLSAFYRDRLVNDTLPFWIGHCVDRVQGGYQTWLDRDGSVLCTDKSLWVQGRFAWLLARLYNLLERREEWLELSRHGIEFIRRHGFGPDGRMLYHVARDGRPLRREAYPFAECFAVVAFAEYSRASGDSDALATARDLFSRVLELYRGPSLLSPEGFPQTRSARSHALTMILINTVQVLRAADTRGDYSEIMDGLIEDLFAWFVKPQMRALLETVGPAGEVLESPEGRCLNPGHALETAWFLLEESRSRHDRGLAERVLPLIEWSLERGWDPEYGGILYFVDVEGKPPAPLEWDMKLWWPHNEAIYATLLAWALTGESRFEGWFRKIQAWALRRFPDRRYGEWYGYLHRDGSPASRLKGNNRKGPYHLPRQQLLTHLLLEEMLTGSSSLLW